MEQVWAGRCQSFAGVALLAVSVGASPVGTVANKGNAATAQGLSRLQGRQAQRWGTWPRGWLAGWLLAGKAEVPLGGSGLP